MTQKRRRIHFRHGSGPLGIRAQDPAGIARPVDALGKYGVGAVGTGLDDHVIGFRHSNAELIDRNRLNVLSIGGHYRHFQAGNSHIVNCHGRAIDKTKPDFLTALEQAEPAIVRCRAVHQKGVGVAGNVSKIAVAHAHLVPHGAIFSRLAKAFFRYVAEEIASRSIAKIVIVALLFKFAIDSLGFFVAPVRQQHDVIPVVAHRIGSGRINDDGAIQPGLFLKIGMTVIPESAVLPHVELIDKCFTGLDTVETNTRHAVHRCIENHTVPVNGRVMRQMVSDTQCHALTLAPAQNRPGYRAVKCGRGPLATGKIDRLVADVDIEARATQRGHRLPSESSGKGWIRRQSKTQQRTSRRRTGYETAAGNQCRFVR